MRATSTYDTPLAGTIFLVDRAERAVTFYKGCRQAAGHGCLAVAIGLHLSPADRRRLEDLVRDLGPMIRAGTREEAAADPGSD